MMEYVYVADKSLAELEQMFACHVEDDDFYDVIAYNIAQQDPIRLKNMLAVVDAKRTRACIFGLGFCASTIDDVEIMLGKMLSMADDLVVAEAILSLARLERDTHRKQIAALLKTRGNFVRAAILQYERKLHQEDAFELLIKYLSDDDYIVRESAVDELAELGNVDAVQYIAKLKNDAHPDVRVAVESALSELSEIDG